MIVTKPRVSRPDVRFSVGCFSFRDFSVRVGVNSKVCRITKANSGDENRLSLAVFIGQLLATRVEDTERVFSDLASPKSLHGLRTHTDSCAGGPCQPFLLIGNIYSVGLPASAPF